KPFDMRSVMRAVTDTDHVPFERWGRWRDAEGAIVWEARIGGVPGCPIGLESGKWGRARVLPPHVPPPRASGALLPPSSREAGRATNPAGGERPAGLLRHPPPFHG